MLSPLSRISKEEFTSDQLNASCGERKKKFFLINTQFSFKLMIKSHTNAHVQVQHSHLESPCSMFAVAYPYDKN